MKDMKRRGFLGGIFGLPALAAVVKPTQPPPMDDPTTERVRLHIAGLSFDALEFQWDCNLIEIPPEGRYREYIRGESTVRFAVRCVPFCSATIRSALCARSHATVTVEVPGVFSRSWVVAVTSVSFESDFAVITAREVRGTEVISITNHSTDERYKPFMT